MDAQEPRGTGARVVLALRRAILADALARALEEAAGVQVQAVTRSMAETVGAIRTSMPDAVVLDLFETDADERMAGAALRQVDDRVRLIVLHCGSEPPRDRTGRMIYLTNQDGLARLLDAIRQGHARDGVRSDGWKHTPALSPSERRVAVLVAEGYPNRRIAQELHLSERTVRNYVSNILDKLGLSNRTELAATVVRTPGLILE